MNSREFKEFQSSTEPIIGPIQSQMAIHYTFFIVVLGSAQALDWAPHVRYYMMFVYAVISVIMWEISRMIYIFKNKHSVIPLYLSLINFLALVVLSREAHIIAGVLWYVSALTIHLQSGTKWLHGHIALFSVLYIIVYLGGLLFMELFFIDSTGLSTKSGDKLDPEIDWGEECTLFVGIGLMSVAYFNLERYIKNFAKTILERSVYQTKLYNDNARLKDELKLVKTKSGFDMNVPIVKALDILGTTKDILIKSNPSISSDLQTVLDMLKINMNKLYVPNLSSNKIDNDTKLWLNDLLTSEEKKSSPLNTEGSAESSQSQFMTKYKKRHSHDEYSFSLFDSMHSRSNNSNNNAPLLEQLNEINVIDSLFKSDSWDFDVIDFARLTNGQPLYYLGLHLFEKYNFMTKFLIDRSVARQWLRAIESGYRSENSYHNSTHAADVTQTMHYFLLRDRLFGLLSDEDKFAAIIASMIHDFEHPGTNNQYQISAESSFAMMYNDSSVLENHHSAAAFILTLNTPECNIFQNVSSETYTTLRKSIVDMVLATDISFHFDYLGKFQNQMSIGSGNSNDYGIILEMAIKCADVSNPAKTRSLSVAWTESIMEEFFKQGDLERSSGLPVSMFMDRLTTVIPKCQIGFIDFVVGPSFNTWTSYIDSEDMNICIDNINSNREYWTKELELYNNGNAV